MIDLAPILAKSQDYLRTLGNLQTQRRNALLVFTCPFCQHEPASCNFVPGNKMKCQRCQARGFFTVLDVVRFREPDKAEWTDEAIGRYLAGKLGVTLRETYSTDAVLDYYQDKVFDLVPVVANDKRPFEEQWPQKTHKAKAEWEGWLNTGLNIGVKTGKVSGVTVIDIDQKPIPPEIEALRGECPVQETPNGCHLFYQYDAELPKSAIREDGLKIDIENDGGQVVVMPSTVDGKPRYFRELIDIPKIPAAFKEYLMAKLPNRKSAPLVNGPVMAPTPSVEGPTEDYDISAVNDGSRNVTMIRLGGILRKKLNLNQTAHVLDLFNRNFLKPPLTGEEMRRLIQQLDKYIGFDEHELAVRVHNYLKLVGEAFAKEVQEALGEPKQKIDKVLAYLVKEGQVVKARRMYSAVRKATWSDTFPQVDKVVPWRMPYFHDYAVFQYGDLMLLGSKTAFGKTTIAINMIHQFVQQSIKPYYIYLETGSRFVKTAVKLGLKEGDFFHAFEPDPTKIELEPNSVTILDWLLVEDKATTDVVMKHFNEQLQKNGGVLVIFMQLKENEEWFAPNMAKQFPAFAARYLYEDETGIVGKWVVDKNRESKVRSKFFTIPCRYDHATKILAPIKDVQGPANAQVGV